MDAYETTTQQADLDEVLVCFQWNDILLKQSYYMLIAAIFTIMLLSLFVHRKRLRLNCCRGRPGVLQPINQLDAIRRRWMYVACFIILAHAVQGQTSILYHWNDDKDADWNFKFSWISIILQIVMMTHFCIVYYPLFACVTYRTSIIANVAGLLYVIPLFVVECLLILRCRANTLPQRLVIMWRMPSFISHVVYMFGTVFELLTNLRKLPVTVTTSFGEIRPEYESYMTYVRHLLKRKQKQTDPENNTAPSTTVSKWRMSAVCLLKRLKYENVPGFRYSTAMLSSTMVSVTAIFLGVIALSLAVDLLYKELHKTVSTLLKVQFLNVEITWTDNGVKILDYMYIIRVVFHVTNVFAGIFQLVFNGHVLVSYRRNMLLMYRGIHNWYHKRTVTPTTLMVEAMSYPSYHIVYCSLGFLLTLIVMFIAVSLVAILVIVPIRDRQITYVIRKIVFIGPTAIVILMISAVHHLLCRFVFLQTSNTLAIENRRLYFVLSYFTFMIKIFVGIFSALRRLLIAVVIGACLIGRLDHVVTMRGFERFDHAHRTYLSMLTVEVSQNHPVMRAFVELLRRMTSVDCKDERNCFTNPDFVACRHNGKQSQRIRRRWFKMVTLINNPSLVDDKLNQLRREVINERRSRDEKGKGQDVSSIESSSSFDSGDYNF